MHRIYISLQTCVHTCMQTNIHACIHIYIFQLDFGRGENKTPSIGVLGIFIIRLSES